MPPNKTWTEHATSIYGIAALVTALTVLVTGAYSVFEFVESIAYKVDIEKKLVRFERQDIRNQVTHWKWHLRKLQAKEAEGKADAIDRREIRELENLIEDRETELSGRGE